VAKGEKGLTTLAPIVILMVLIVALGVSAPPPLYTLMDRATSVVSEGIPLVQATGMGLPADSLSRSLDQWEAQAPITILRIQSGH
jgi:hypothetical protein